MDYPTIRRELTGIDIDFNTNANTTLRSRRSLQHMSPYDRDKTNFYQCVYFRSEEWKSIDAANAVAGYKTNFAAGAKVCWL